MWRASTYTASTRFPAIVQSFSDIHIYLALCHPLDTNIVICNLNSRLLHSKESLKKDLLHSPVSQRGTVNITAGTEDIVEGACRILQLFKVGGEMVRQP